MYNEEIEEMSVLQINFWFIVTRYVHVCIQLRDRGRQLVQCVHHLIVFNCPKLNTNDIIDANI